MSLEAILEAIYAAGDKEVREIEKEAYIEAQKLGSEAKIEGQRLQRETRDNVILPAYRERAKKIQQARLSALQAVGQARESLVDEALTLLRGRLSNIRNEYQYPTILKNLIVESLEELASSLDENRKIYLQADERDRERIESLNSSLAQEIEIDYTINTWGGVIALDAGCAVTVINTLEARLERSTPYLRRFLGAIFMDQEAEPTAETMGEAQHS